VELNLDLTERPQNVESLKKGKTIFVLDDDFSGVDPSVNPIVSERVEKQDDQGLFLTDRGAEEDNISVINATRAAEIELEYTKSSHRVQES
jgi:hypothetical protein